MGSGGRAQCSFEEDRTSGPRPPAEDKKLEDNLAPPSFPVANLNLSKSLPAQSLTQGKEDKCMSGRQSISLRA